MNHRTKKAKASLLLWWGCLSSAAPMMIVPACGGEVTDPAVSSESHFLRLCQEDEDCVDENLNCIGGICTQGCLTGQDSECSSLGADATCTNESVEAGEVAVCDRSCSLDFDCRGISTNHECTGGFCRAQHVENREGISSVGSVFQSALPIEGPERLRCMPEGYFLTESTFHCAMVEASLLSSLDCEAEGRTSVGSIMRSGVLSALLEVGHCGEEIDCDSASLCEILQLTGAERQACLSDVTPAEIFPSEGFCVIDESLRDAEGNLIAGGIEEGVNPLVEHCPEGERSDIRFVGGATPSRMLPYPPTHLRLSYWMVCENPL
jgi:hypothetical protein